MKKVKDMIPHSEKPWNERNTSEKLQAIIKYKMDIILCCCLPFRIFWSIMALITQLWILLALQGACYLMVSFCLYTIAHPIKGWAPGRPSAFFTAIAFALAAITLKIGYF